MNAINDEELSAEARKAYYAEAHSWSDDRNAALSRSRRAAWIVAAVAAGIAALEALALVALTPLKTVEPYTILVDRNTGFAQALDGTGVPRISGQSALTRSLLAQYVIARESFAGDSVQERYRKTALWSGDNARREYLALMAPGNPRSPVNMNRRGARLDTRIESVSVTGPDKALVRFYTEQIEQGQPRGARQYWVALLKYRFSGEPLAIEDRLVNPLGFQVTEYQRDQEVPPVAENVAAPAPDRLAVPGSETERPQFIQPGGAGQ